jgi:RNA polymerase sigma-70 factor (sigma-E family)
VEFAQFVRTSMPALSRTAFLLTGNRASAEDLVQETFVRLFRRRDWLLAADVPVAYARRALANQFVNDRRRASSREIILADLPETKRSTPDSSGDLVERDAMWRLLATLPDRQRVAIVLRFYDDLPDEEIAEALGARLGTVRSLISRGLSALRADPALADIGGGQR